jgi:anhydro-N-acetylmuramic acid kinase
MKQLLELTRKETKTIAGLMSGTSLDGIDAVLVKVSGAGTSTRFEQIAFETVQFPQGARELILRNSARETSNVEDICRLNIYLAHLYADAVKKIAAATKIDLNEIDLIGSHGQTIHHLPQTYDMFGLEVKSTLQIGDPSTIAKLTGIISVGDFRTSDMAVGGEGAPLVPYFDYIIFRSKTINRGLLNIGGIANITVLPKDSAVKDVLAFDTGPGNMVVDALMKRFYDRDFDKNGEVASNGTIFPGLHQKLETDDFVSKRPPKSTGRERYGRQYVENLLSQPGCQTADIIATVTDYTAWAIFRNYELFIQPETTLDELLVSGGGAHNRFMMKSLSKYFQGVDVKPIEDYGFSSDAKEAICFAILANETISGNSANVPRTTGAKRPTILGKICLP